MATEGSGGVIDGIAERANDVFENMKKMIKAGLRDQREQELVNAVCQLAQEVRDLAHEVNKLDKVTLATLRGSSN